MDKSIIHSEVKYKAIRSSGAGGQHVNKVSTKVELTFDLANSAAFRPNEKERLFKKLEHKLTSNGLIVIQSQESRSQLKNKKVALAKLIAMLENALIVPKRRKKTLPSKQILAKRMKAKKIQSEKKLNRRKPGL